MEELKASKQLDDYRVLIEESLNGYLKFPESPFRSVTDAMAYSTEGGGKRIRPALLLEFCRITGGDIEKALPFACALEMIHTYSLIHDDLPCMDNDNLRRGKPSCHKAYGEDIALLAGDGLLTYAFQVAASAGKISADKSVEAIRILAFLSGVSGMIGGQEIDLKSEDVRIDFETLRQMDLMKTGGLIRAAAQIGCVLGNASKLQMTAADRYASDVGIAFQITDDILDKTADVEVLGKPVLSDEGNRKSTYVSLLGLDGARHEAQRLFESAKSHLSVFEDEAGFLIELCDILSVREF